MSDIIPPLISDTPPPPPCLDEEDDDEFGTFVGSNEISYGCESFSLPTTPEHSPKKVSIPNELDINSNSEKSLPKTSDQKQNTTKDHYDRRKSKFEEIPKLNVSLNGCLQDIPVEQENDIYTADSFQTIPGENPDSELPVISKDEDNVLHKINKVDDEVIKPEDKEGSCSEVIETSLNVAEVSHNIEIKLNNLEIDDTSQVLENPSELFREINYKNGHHILNNSVINEECSENNFSEKIDKKNEYSISNKLENIQSVDLGSSPTFDRLEDHTEIFLNSTHSLEDPYVEKAHVPVRDFEINVTGTLSDSIIKNKSVENYDTLVSSQSVVPTHEDNDDFADFSGFVSSNQEITSFTIENTLPITSDNVISEDDVANENDDFGEFNDFVSTTASAKQLEDDDFGDFQNISTEALSLPSNPLEKAQQLFEETFPKIGIEEPNYIYETLEKDNHLFDTLKDITDTPGLTYQWSKSASQKLLLKALNIDERNILQPWNASMPIFASNLSLQPLEPIKTEVSSPQAPSVSPSISVKSMSTEIPSAQFDWKGSGLENPLETVSQDASLPVTEISNELDFKRNSQKPIDSILQKDIPLKTEDEEKIPPTFNLSEFSLDSDIQNWTNVTPLRETHISNKNSENVDNSDLDCSIQETYLNSLNIITNKEHVKDIPEEDDFDEFQAAPIKSTSKSDKEIRKTKAMMDNTSTPSYAPQGGDASNTESFNNDMSYTENRKSSLINSGNNEDVTWKSRLELDKRSSQEQVIDNDEFTDFQSSYPNSMLHSNTVLQPVSSGLSLEPLKPVPVYKQPSSSSPAQINWPDPGVTEDDLKKFENLFAVPSTSHVENTPKPGNQILDTEISNKNQGSPNKSWTNFASHGVTNVSEVSNNSEITLTSLNNVTTKKSPKIENNFSKSTTSSKKIENSTEIWTDFIKPKIENTMQTTQKSNYNDHMKRISSTDEDEWSDFVSAQKPSPVHKVTMRDMERTSSPDLPLSVFNLGSVQPARQPIPVITPHGLVQTKLSTNMGNASPKLQQKNTKQYYQPAQPKSVISPSIISSQYVSQAYNVNYMAAGQHLSSSEGKGNQNHVDDEWGDFVSSPLPQQQPANGYRHQMPFQGAQSSFVKSSPNIITNPRHYMQSGSDVNKRASNVTTTKKNMVPNLVLPELDFVAPKTRTSVTRKK